MSLQPSMEQNRARGYGCLAIIIGLLLIQYPMDQIGQLVGIYRDADDTAGLLRWHLWSLAWLTVLPVSLFMVCRLFRNTNDDTVANYIYRASVPGVNSFYQYVKASFRSCVALRLFLIFL